MSDDRAKVLALLEKLRELDDDYTSKREALLDEIAARAGGGEPISAKLRYLRGVICASWQERYHEPMDYRDTEIVPHLKRWLVKSKMSKDAIEARWRNFIGSSDPFYVQRRHALLIFVRDFNSLVGLPLVHDADASADATAAKMRERRGA